MAPFCESLPPAGYFTVLYPSHGKLCLAWWGRRANSMSLLAVVFPTKFPLAYVNQPIALAATHGN
jgi:hypothetical protein